MDRVELAQQTLSAAVEFFLTDAIWKEEDGASGRPGLPERMKSLGILMGKLGGDFEALEKENRELKVKLGQIKSQLNPGVGLGKRKEMEEEDHNLHGKVKRPCVQEATATPKPKLRTYPLMQCPLCDRKFIFESAYHAHLKTHQDRDAQPSASSTSGPGPQGDGDLVVLDISSDDDDQEQDNECQNEPLKHESPPMEKSASPVVKQEQAYQEESSLVGSVVSSATGLEGEYQGSGLEMVDDDKSAASFDGNHNLISQETTQQQLDENSFMAGFEFPDQRQQQVQVLPPSKTLEVFQLINGNSAGIGEGGVSFIVHPRSFYNVPELTGLDPRHCDFRPQLQLMTLSVPPTFDVDQWQPSLQLPSTYSGNQNQPVQPQSVYGPSSCSVEGCWCSNNLSLLAEVSGGMKPADLGPTLETPGFASSPPVDALSVTENSSSMSPCGTASSSLGGNENGDGEYGPVPLDEPGCPPISSLEKNKYLRCTECGKSFSSKAALKIHYERFCHKQGSAPPTSSKCSLCDQDFKDEIELVCHLQTDHSDPVDSFSVVRAPLLNVIDWPCY